MKKRASKATSKRYAWIPTGVANLYTRGTKYYFVKMVKGRRTFSLLTDVEGKPIFSPDLPEAIKAATRISGNPFVKSAETMDSTLERFYEAKIAAGDWRPTTRTSHRPTYNLFSRAMGKPLNAITARDLQEWYKGLLKTMKLVSANTYFACIASLFRWAHKERLISQNPILDVIIEKLEPGEDKPFCTYDQRDQLIKECPKGRDDLKLFLILGFHCGLRRREIDSARVDWIDMGRRVVRVKNVRAPSNGTEGFLIKNKKERTVPLSKEASVFFADYLSKLPADAVFLLHPEKLVRGKAKYRYDMRRPYEEYCKKCGLPWVTIHTMRHTFASLLATSGKATIEMIADWLGDTIRTTEDTYAKLIPRHDIIESAFSERPHFDIIQEEAPI